MALGWSLMVRLSFPNGEHTDVKLAPGEIRIGSASDNDVVLRGEGIRPHHASVLVDNRGVILRVHTRDAWTHLNARPVVDLALVRGGDLITVDQVRIAIKPLDESALKPAGTSAPDPAQQEFGAGSRVALRGLSGRNFGIAVPLLKPLVIGREASCDIVLDDDNALALKHARIEIAPEGAYLRSVDGRSEFEVNGVVRSDATLHGGDQITFRQDRFLLEAPGLPARGTARPAAAPSAPPALITQTLRAITAADVAGATPPPPDLHEALPIEPAASPWLLILAGALIAAALAMLFLHGSSP